MRRYHLLKPDPEVTDAFVYLLAVMAAKHGVAVHAGVLMSTHYHLVLTDKRGRLPAFLTELNRLVALVVKVIRKWEGPLWDHREPSIVHLRTPEALVEKLAYVAANPVQTGRVSRGYQWPGLVTTPAQLGRKRLVAKRPEQYLDAGNRQWPEKARLELSLPELPWKPNDARKLVAREAKCAERAAVQDMANKGRRILGLSRICRLSPYRRSTGFEPVRGLNPSFAVGRGRREEFFEAVLELRTFRRLYREALQRWRAGIRNVVFPRGTYAMVWNHAVATSPT
jgi:putative transposase